MRKDPTVPTARAKLAESLKALKALQDEGTVAIRNSDLTRTHRERLLKNGFLRQVMKGWLIAARPDEKQGDSSAWYTSFWDFTTAYLKERFGNNWSLSPEQSLLLHAGNRTVPRQLNVRAPNAGTWKTELGHNTSILVVRASLPDQKDRVTMDSMELYSIPAALVASSPAFFSQHSIDARAILATINNASPVLGHLLEGGHTVAAGRLAGAFRNIGRNRIADDIIEGMKAADYDVRENDPFKDRIELNLPRREPSPYAARIKTMWKQMREEIPTNFPRPLGIPNDSEAYLKRVDEVYTTDAYHSLSIEGYRVSVELIEKVRSGNWSPEKDDQDRGLSNAIAARGYWQAFKSVKKSVIRVLRNENPGKVAEKDHGVWHREMFAPRVTAGLMRASSLAGYRENPVYIRQSMHVPLPHHGVSDAMSTFFELLESENEPAVRVVLGHFVFVYIHPYIDGNGRIGRFLMNLMLASGGFPWTVVPVQQRVSYMAALEAASVEQNITPFTRFLGMLVQNELEGRNIAKLPV
jgi:hypothetical protein